MTAEQRRSGEIAILSPDGRFLAVPGENHTVLVLDGTTNRPDRHVGRLGEPLVAAGNEIERWPER